MDGSLATESVRVPVDDHVPMKTRIEQKMYPEAAIEDAKKKEEKELQMSSQIDNDYVNRFLKEIDEIENINHRADKYIEDRTFETYMRRAPDGVNVPREEHKAASPIMPRTPANEPPEVELNTNSFFITESPNLSQQVDQ